MDGLLGLNKEDFESFQGVDTWYHQQQMICLKIIDVMANERVKPTLISLSITM